MKVIFTLIIGLFILSAAQAQGNLALTATPTASASSSGNYGPSNWNDGLIGPSYYFGWLGTDPSSFPTPWLQYEWGSAVTLNTIVLHPPTWSNPGYVYFYGGATVQYWDGSTWVSHQNFLSLDPTIIDTVEFIEITTTKIRLANFNITGQHNPGWDEIEVYYIAPPQVDMAVTEVISPPDTLWSSNNYPVSLRIKNFGPDVVTAFDIGYEIDNQSDLENWQGTLNPGDSGIYQFSPSIDPTLLSSPLLNCKFFVVATGDVDHSNDTLEMVKHLLTVGLYDRRDEGKMLIYPNPVNEWLTIHNMNAKALETIYIYSSGQLVRTFEKRIAHGNTYTIDLSDLPPGQYILHAGEERHVIIKAE